MTMRTLLVATGALAAISAAIPAHALPVDQYLKVRRQSGYDPHLAYTQFQAEPSKYAGHTTEIRGKLSGTIRREGTVAFLITLSDNSSMLLNAPAADADLVREANQQWLRVLVKPYQGEGMGTAPLDVVAICYDADVTLREREAAAKEIAAARRKADEAARLRARRAVIVSRQGNVRYAPPAAPVGGVSNMARQYLTPQAQAIYPQYRSYIRNCNPRLSATELDTITVSILHFSQRYKLDPRLAIAMIIAESDFDPRSTSSKGAMGLGQLMPDEAQALKLPNPYDPVWNIKGAVNLLKGKLDKYREPGAPTDQLTWRQIELALAAYNAGPGAVRRYGGVPPYRETQGYVKKVIRIYKQLIGS